MVKRGLLVIALAAIVAAVVGISYAYLRPKSSDSTLDASEPPGARSQTPSSFGSLEVTTTSAPFTISDGASPGQDPVATMAVVLEARKHGDTRTLEQWTTPEAATQLQSYPPEAFDPAQTECRPAPDRPQSDMLCTLKPSRFMLGEVVARLRQSGEGYRLIRITPVVD